MKHERLNAKQAAMVALATVVIVPAWTVLGFYDHAINGVDAKSGALWKHKTIDGVRYTKQKGLVNVFKKWRPLGPATLNCLDVNSLYPYMHK